MDPANPQLSRGVVGSVTRLVNARLSGPNRTGLIPVEKKTEKCFREVAAKKKLASKKITGFGSCCSYNWAPAVNSLAQRVGGGGAGVGVGGPLRGQRANLQTN